MNYQGNTYENSIKGFKKWAKDNPGMATIKRKHHKRGSIYMEVYLLEDRETMGFIFREYNEAEQDFDRLDSISHEEATEKFSSSILDYQLENNARRLV